MREQWRPEKVEGEQGGWWWRKYGLFLVPVHVPLNKPECKSIMEGVPKDKRQSSPSHGPLYNYNTEMSRSRGGEPWPPARKWGMWAGLEREKGTQYHFTGKRASGALLPRVTPLVTKDKSGTAAGTGAGVTETPAEPGHSVTRRQCDGGAPAPHGVGVGGQSAQHQGRETSWGPSGAFRLLHCLSEGQWSCCRANSLDLSRAKCN